MPGQNMVLYDNVVEVVGRGITLYSEGKYDAAFDVLVELRRDPVAALFLGTMLHDCDDFIKEDKNSLDKLMRLSFDNVAAIRQRGKGDPRILTMLGVAYYIGISCFPQNNNIVFELFSHASAANDARGIYWLAVCVRYGYGVYENETRATNLFRNATELEDGYALSDMALLYHSVNEQISYMYHCYSSMVGFEKKNLIALVCVLSLAWDVTLTSAKQSAITNAVLERPIQIVVDNYPNS